MQVEEIISSGMLEMYCLGLSSETENKQIKEWIGQYSQIAAAVDGIQLTLYQYAQAHAITPHPSLKEKLFSKIKTDTFSADTSSAKVYSISPIWKRVAAASIILLIGSIVLNMIYLNKYADTNKNLEETQNLLAQEKLQGMEMRRDMGIVQNKYSIPVSLKGMETSPDATAKIFWMQNTGEVMIDASNLPDPPSGKQYQFWAIVDGVPVDGGMIITNGRDKKFKMQKMKSFGKAQAFAISLEKEGGNPAPTTVVSIGKI